jgi:hypothetical protein
LPTQSPMRLKFNKVIAGLGIGVSSAAAAANMLTGSVRMPPSGLPTPANDFTGPSRDRPAVVLTPTPPPTGRAPAYGQLYADGVLKTTMAVGYDEQGAHRQQIHQILEGLTARGFTRFEAATATPEQLAKFGVTRDQLNPNAFYFSRPISRDMQSLVTVITPDQPSAKANFAAAMQSGEVVMYTGHGRVGSGPDFDDIHSAAGNYVIGKPSKASYVTIGANDLKRAKLTNDYQLFFFDGCNTKYYVDDLRSIPKNKTTANLDIVGAQTELPWGTSSADLLAMLDGLEEGHNLQTIGAGVEQSRQPRRPGDLLHD